MEPFFSPSMLAFTWLQPAKTVLASTGACGQWQPFSRQFVQAYVSGESVRMLTDVDSPDDQVVHFQFPDHLETWKSLPGA